jgi:hypothetical protein
LNSRAASGIKPEEERLMRFVTTIGFRALLGCLTVIGGISESRAEVCSVRFEGSGYLSTRYTQCGWLMEKTYQDGERINIDPMAQPRCSQPGFHKNWVQVWWNDDNGNKQDGFVASEFIDRNCNLRLDKDDRPGRGLGQKDDKGAHG